MKEMLDNFKDWLELEGTKSSTVRDYMNVAERFEGFIDLKKTELIENDDDITKWLSEVDQITLRKYLVYLKKNERVGNRSLTKYKTILIKYLRISYERKDFDKIPRLKFKKQKTENVLSKEELALLWKEAPTLLHKAVFRLSYFAALRAGEVANLNREHIDLQNRTLNVAQEVVEKDGVPTIIPITDDKTIDIIRKYIQGEKHSSPKTPLFLRQRKKTRMNSRTVSSILFRRIADKIGLTDKTFHCLRHTRSKMLLQNSVPLQKVQIILRHKSLVTTSDEYGHITPMDQLKEIRDIDKEIDVDGTI